MLTENKSFHYTEIFNLFLEHLFSPNIVERQPPIKQRIFKVCDYNLFASCLPQAQSTDVLHWNKLI